MSGLHPAHRDHPRRFEDFWYVYPVLSRRSRGISLGVNVNPDKACNFDCVYCQVDRITPGRPEPFDAERAEMELCAALAMISSGALRDRPPFDTVPRGLLRLNDIALSGDGEPTMLRDFSGVVRMIAKVKPAGVKIVLITDAAGLHRPDVKKGLVLMDHHDGEVWAKLDAGTAVYYRRIDRSKIPFERILANITMTARERAVAIQSLFLRLDGHGPDATEIDAYCGRLRAIVAAGGKISKVQVYTVARRPMALLDGRPAVDLVLPLADAEIEALAAHIRAETGLNVESFLG